MGGNVVLDDWFLLSFFFKKEFIELVKKKERKNSSLWCVGWRPLKSEIRDYICNFLLTTWIGNINIHL